MKYLINIALFLIAIVILIISFYVQVKHQKGRSKQEIPQDVINEVIKEYKEIRNFKEISDKSGATSASLRNDNSKDFGDTDIQTAIASWYDQSVCPEGTYGSTCRTANGEVFDENGLTLAHKSMEFGSRIAFTYRGNTVVCRINDRGPFIPNRSFDLSYGCGQALGIIFKGVTEVEWQLANIEQKKQ